MSKTSFQLISAQFTMDDGFSQDIDFLGPTAIASKTHITLIAGANGTSKSRFLASIVDRFCELNDEASDRKISKRYGSSGNHGLNCERIDTRGQIPKNEKNGAYGSTLLPSKILVLSNLVMDRFRFVQNDPDEDQFYQYLGVRQATNLMTTGSMQRSVSEAIMALYQDEEKRELFQNWIKLVFGNTREIALTFDRISRSQLEKYVSSSDPEKAIIERMLRSRGSARSGDERFLQSTKDAAPAVIRLIEFLLMRAEDAEVIRGKKSDRKNLTLRLDALPNEALNDLADLNFAFVAALKARLFSWPSVSIEGSARSGWTDFGQLSSGEQNILSTGAKLIAHAEPGCLIAIDEPEISLNTSWQQHYTDLVAHSLAQAQGSHVLIATHSPHLIASLPIGEASVILVEKNAEQLKTEVVLDFRPVCSRFKMDHGFI